MRRPAGDAGNAVVEFSTLAVLLMVPLVYVLLSVFEVQRASFGVTEAARQAGRAYVTADDPAQGRARASPAEASAEAAYARPAWRAASVTPNEARCTDRTASSR